jgi:uncharacterized protein YndB with AHSA1/START domain
MAGTISILATYRHAPERVWTALTDPRALAEWLMPNDFAPRLGHRFQFRTKPAPGFDGVVHCEVVELDPPRRLAYSWKGGSIDTVVAWTLTPTAAGTQVRLEQSGFRGVRGVLLRKLVLGPGWRRMMAEKLPQVVARVNDGGFTPDPAMAARACS